MASVVDIIIKTTGGVQAARAFGEIKSSVAGLAAQLLPFAVGGGIVATLTSMGSAAATLADRFDDLGQRVGTTSQAVQVLDYLGRRFGQNAEVFVGALGKLRVNLQNIKEGASDGYAPIKRLGLTLAELQNATPERQLELLARQMVNATDKNQAFNDVAELIGSKTAPELRAALERLGVDGYEKLEQAATSAGQVLDKETTQRLADAKKKIEDFQRAATIFAGEFLGNVGQLIDTRSSDREKSLAAQIGVLERELKKSEGQRRNPFLLGSGGATDEELRARIENLRAEIVAIGKFKAAEAEVDKRIADSVAAEENADPFGIKAAAKAEADAAKARAQAQEQAHAWLVKNRAEYEKAIEAAKRLAGTDADRLVFLGEEKFRLLQKYASAEFAARSADEHERVRLEAERALLPIEKELATLRKKFADEAERASKEIVRINIETARERLAAQIADIGSRSAALAAKFGTTDAEKWNERRRLLEQTVAVQREYLRQAKAIEEATRNPKNAGGISALIPSTPEAQAEAKKAVSQAQTGVTQAEGALANVGPNPNSVRDQIGVGMKDMMEEWGTQAQRVAGLITGPIRAGLQGVKSVMQGLLGDTAYWSQELGTIGGSVMGAITAAITDLFVQWIAGRISAFAASIGLLGSETAASAAAATAQTALWSVPATLATIASFGAAAAQAPASMALSLAASKAITGLAQAVPGFSEGGFTGAGGIVHANEFVFSAPAVRSMGVANLATMHEAAKSGSPVASSSSGAGSGNSPISIAIVQSEEAGMRWLDGQRGRKRLIRQMNLNRAELGIVA